MSLLMYCVSPARVTLFTDTLSATPDGHARHLTTKCWTFPHIGVAVAFTGLAQVGYRWIATITESMLCRDIDMLDVHAPEALRRVVADVTEQYGGIHGTTTVYHFGQSEATKEYVGYAYRSTADFASERLLAEGFGVKPPPADGITVVPQTVEDVIALAELIKTEQDALDAAVRLYIGGDLVMVHLEGGVMTAARIHRFDDYEQDWQSMNDRIARERAAEPEELV